jgi:hypothetical protein
MTEPSGLTMTIVESGCPMRTLIAIPGCVTRTRARKREERFTEFERKASARHFIVDLEWAGNPERAARSNDCREQGE